MSEMNTENISKLALILPIFNPPPKKQKSKTMASIGRLAIAPTDHFKR